MQQALHAEFGRQIDHERVQGRVKIRSAHALLQVFAMPVTILLADEEAVRAVAKEQAVCVHSGWRAIWVFGRGWASIWARALLDFLPLESSVPTPKTTDVNL